MTSFASEPMRSGLHDIAELQGFAGHRAPGATGAGEWLYRKGLQALPAHIAVVDEAGRIVLVNQAWTAFAQRNGAGDHAGVMVGASYLEICRHAAAADTFARQALQGIEAVLSGTQAQFSMEYPCYTATDLYWFVMTVASLGPGTSSGAIISHQDITASKHAQAAQYANDARVRAMFENAAVGIAELAPDGRWLSVNRQLSRITRHSAAELQSKTLFDITHAADADADRANIEAMRSGGVDSYSAERRFLRPGGAEIWVNATVSCVRAADGAIDRFILVAEDISERKRAEERQRVLLLELAHRGKNLLAVIQSIASRSLSGEHSLPEAREAFNRRLHALSKTYGTFTSDSFNGAPLAGILMNELSAFGGRANVDGPGILLTVKAAQTFTLIAHELATNAAKYGALSVPGGHLRVAWRIAGTAGQPRLLFDWDEQGGPPAVPPTRRGFGTTLIAQVAGAEFDCKPQLDYGQQGFRYRLDAPLERLGSVVPDSPVRRKLQSEIVCSLYDTWAQRRGADGALPRLSGFDWTRFAATGALTIAQIQADGAVVFVQVGHALIEELGRPIAESDLNDEDPDGLADVYRRCARTGEPTHEFLRFDFGDNDPLTFERLLVPFSASLNRTVTHVVGIALYNGHTRGQEPGDD